MEDVTDQKGDGGGGGRGVKIIYYAQILVLMFWSVSVLCISWASLANQI